MHTAELLDEALTLARQAGYTIREECLGGCRGGACEIRGKKILFLDLDQGPRERLEQVAESLRNESSVARLPQYHRLVGLLKS